MPNASGGKHHVVIIGGGFGGLYAAQHLSHAPVEITLIDRRNFHLFQPLLYQVATGGLSPANISAPLRAVLKRQKNARVWLGEATGFDVASRRVLLSDGAVAYDTLIVAAGATHHYFGHPDWEAVAPGLKTIEDAVAMRGRILLAFEAAERETDPERRRAWLTFVLVGAGPTGVELAGALSEVANDTLRHDFRSIDPRDARILLVEGADRVLTAYPQPLSAAARKTLEKLGVKVITGAKVTAIQPDHVECACQGRTETIPTHTVLWAAGICGVPLGKALANATGATVDRSGRVVVQPDLTLPGYPDILVIGDLASFAQPSGQPLPGVAQVAMQQGRYAAQLIRARLAGKTLPPFQYRDKGNLATIGRAAAVAELGRLRIQGWVAWIIWLFVHLLYIVEFESRLLVMMQWAWNYFTRNRAARLITGENPLPLDL